MMNHRRTLPRLLLFVALLACSAGEARAGAPARETHRAREARALVDRAIARLARRTFEGRRAAIADLERATALAPDAADYHLLLARTYYEAGFVRSARQRFSQAESLDPRDAAAQYGLGQVWRRDWLKYVDTLSLERAAEHFESAGRLDTTRAEPWLMAVSLRLEMHDPLAADTAAARAFAADPRSPEVALARATASWRLGRAEEAEQLFESAIPRLPRSVHERFDDIAPVSSEQDTLIYNHLSAPGRAEFARQFWSEHDPDLATPENEAQLEYWARVTQAYLLFWNPKHREWDERGEVYVRYGPPTRAEYNPLGVLLYTSIGGSGTLYPMNVMVWDYPQLGMTVALQDRLLSEYYQLPMTREYDPDPRPDPDSLAALDAVGTHDLRGVFPTLPPGIQRLRLDGDVARFRSGSGPHLLATLETASSPGDSLVATAVVIDSAAREVARSSRPLSPSACEATRFRVADFASDLPPGRYWVGLEVRAGSRRGAVRLPVTLVAGSDRLSLSDLVVTCGSPLVFGPGLRLDPNPLARVPADAPLTAYFEIYDLTPGADGMAHYEYEYRVKSAERDPRIWLQRVLAPRPAPPEIQTLSEQSNTGPMRRQFVSVPVQGLPAGRYRLEVMVRDLATGDEARTAAEFTRLSATGE